MTYYTVSSVQPAQTCQEPGFHLELKSNLKGSNHKWTALVQVGILPGCIEEALRSETTFRGGLGHM